MSDMAVVKYVSEAGSDIELTPALVKQYLVSGDPDNVTNQELGMFMMMCKFQGLNPFLKEAYLIKYGTSPATIVTGKDVFLKRATRNPRYQGHTVGASDDGKMAWAEVHKEGFVVPIRVEVAYDEYVGKKKSGEINSMWTSKPKTMLKKVALAQALREAFPEDLGGMYSKEEAESFIDVTPEKQVSKSSTVRPQGAEIAPLSKEEEKTAGNLQKQASQLKKDSVEPEGTKKQFKTLIRKYCKGDKEQMQALQDELTMYNDKPVPNVDTANVTRIKIALDKLNKRIAEEYPKGCSCDPTTCPLVSYEEEMPYCSTTSEECPFSADF
jgi:phage recombination protein Bet